MLDSINRPMGRRRFNGIAPDGSLNDLHRKLGMPLNLPQLPERPLASRLACLPPRHIQNQQPMQQMAACQIVVFTQIKLQFGCHGRRLHAKRFLELLKILLQWHGRRIVGNLAQGAAHHQFFMNEVQRQFITER